MRQGEAAHGAGHADREARIARFARIGLAALVEEHVVGRRGRRRLAIIDGDRLAALGEVHEHEAAAAEIARPRQGHGQGEADRHGRIDGVAAALEDLDADARRLRLLGGDHAVRGDDRQEARRVRQDGLAAPRHAGRSALRLRERRRGQDRR